jgi:outer membrane lipoprotein-sorting protein
MAQVLFPGRRFTDENGNPISGGKLYTYEAGTITPLDTYINDVLTTSAPNPIVLSSAGMMTTNGVDEGPIYVAPDDYRLVLKSSDDATTYFDIDALTIIDPDTASAVASETLTSNTTVASDDLNRLFYINTASGDVTITADAETLGSGFVFHAKKSSSDSNSGIVAGTGAQVIDGNATFTLDAQYDSATFISLGAAGWAILAQTLDTATLVSDNAIQKLQVALNAGRLEYTNTTTLTFKPYKGGYVCFPSGTSLPIGSSGKTLSATGLTIDQLYYIYAYDNSGTLALEASTTGHSADTTTGIEIKTGDATRVLVGMAEIVDLGSSTPGFADSATQRLVVSWNNRKARNLRNVFTVNRTYGTASWGEINSEIRVEFLCWGDEAVNACVFPQITSGWADGRRIATAVSMDGSSSTLDYTQLEGMDGSDNVDGWTSTAPKHLVPSAGFHYLTLIANSITGNTMTFSDATSLTAIVG